MSFRLPVEVSEFEIRAERKEALHRFSCHNFEVSLRRKPLFRLQAFILFRSGPQDFRFENFHSVFMYSLRYVNSRAVLLAAFILLFSIRKARSSGRMQLAADR